MTDMRSQPTIEGSTAPTDDEICDQVFGTRFYYVRGQSMGSLLPHSHARLGLTSILFVRLD